MASGSLLDADYSDKELQAAHTASKAKSEKLHKKAWDFITRVCPFGKR